MIKELGPNDVDQFIRLRYESINSEQEAFGAEGGIPLDKEKTLHDLKLKNQENFILGYMIDGFLCGICGFLRYPRKKKNHRGFIWGVYVEPAYRGKGISKTLLKETLLMCRKIERLEMVELTVSHTSEQAIKLYENFGFKVYGLEKKSMKVNDQYVHTLYMQRDNDFSVRELY